VIPLSRRAGKMNSRQAKSVVDVEPATVTATATWRNWLQVWAKTPQGMHRTPKGWQVLRLAGMILPC
jgi:hypothetical protein